MRRLLLLFAIITSPLLSQDATPAAPDPDAWRTLPLWDAGGAEYSAYAVDWKHYQDTYKARALIVVVKESWAPDLDVKADTARDDGFEVLKLNHIRDARTGIYRYHQMASTFIRRDDGSLRKLSTSSAEACGVTTSDLRKGVLRTRSYFDEQGDRETAWPKDGVPTDALPMIARGLVRPSATKSVNLFPTLLSGRLPPLRAREWKVSRRGLGEVKTPGLRCDATEVTLTRGKRAHRFAFETQTPHRMLIWEHPDGTTYRLAKTDQLAYWDKNGPGEEAWWPEALR